MSYLEWILPVLYVLVIVGTMVRILLENRSPAKTMAWLLVLAFLPVVGIVLFFFFGQDTRRERHISQQSMDMLTKRSMLSFAEQKDMHFPERSQALMKLFYNQNMALPFKNNETEIYTSGYEFFPALLKAIAEARHHIHINTYIIEDDPLGNLVSDALCAKSQEGVEVRLIYDDVGCWKVKGRFFERMREAGIDIHAFMPVKFPMFTSKVNYRNHRKICVIDGTTGFIGGMNIALRYVKGTGHQPWRDTHLRLRGGIVYALQRAFLVDWYFVDRTLIAGEEYYPELAAEIRNDALAQVVTSSPTSEWPDIMQGYVRILLQARQYVYMESPYFLPTEPILFAMRTAALAGVDVRLMIPLHGDAKLVEWGSRSYVMQTLEAGVKVYLYRAGFNHSKLLISDDSVATCGSTNVDFRSFENNFEANVFFFDTETALRLKKVFLDDEKECFLLNERFDIEQLSRRPLYQRLWESLIRLLSPLL